MTTLNIGDGFKLPLDAVTETIAVLGIRGSGKTNTATVIAEELLQRHQQVVIIDPTDVWWGLKSSADGDAAGYPVVVLGGRRQDLPLGGGDGATIADFVVEHRASVVCSVRHFESKAEQRRFVRDFARRLYFRKGQEGNDTPLMLMIDEASLFVPQRVGPSEAEMVGAIQQLVRQGRSSGIGVTLIDQRAATVNKDVLTQLEVLVCHRTSAPQDRKALTEWVRQHDADEREADFLAKLASLPKGTAWFWSPGWLDVFRSVAVRLRRTFDSSRTPKAGERATVPTKVATVDLEGLKSKLGATIDKARADDPVALRKRIAELERASKSAPSAPPVVDDAAIARAVRDATVRLTAEYDRRLTEAKRGIRAIVQPVVDAVGVLNADIASTLDLLLARVDAPLLIEQRPAPAPRAVAPVARPSRPATSTPPDGDLGAGERTVLTAVAQYPDGVSRDQLTVLTGYKRSSRDTYLQRLRARGYVEADATRVTATGAGISALGSDYEPLPTGAALRDYWLARLGEGERKILEVVADAWPDTVSRDALDRATGYKRSSRDTYLQRLRSRRLVTVERDGARASDTLFDTGARGVR